MDRVNKRGILLRGLVLWRELLPTFMDVEMEGAIQYMHRIDQFDN